MYYLLSKRIDREWFPLIRPKLTQDSLSLTAGVAIKSVCRGSTRTSIRSDTIIGGQHVCSTLLRKQIRRPRPLNVHILSRVYQAIVPRRPSGGQYVNNVISFRFFHRPRRTKKKTRARARISTFELLFFSVRVYSRG